MRNLSLITFLAVASQLSAQSCRNFPGITICVGLTPKSGPHLEVNETSFAVLHGNMSVLQATFFNRLTHLERLYFNTTNVWKIEKGALADLHKLKVLGLTGNKIASIEDGAFSNCNSLETLDLTGNDIEFVSNVKWKGLDNLNNLILRHNFISTISPSDFDNLEQLKLLDLSMNYFEHLNSSSFHVLKNLRILNLSKNLIETIESGTFNGLVNLEELHLESNHLTKTETVFLKETLPKVRQVYLGKNKFSCERVRSEMNLTYSILC